MALVTCYFQFHQPVRLHPEGDPFLWNDRNGEVFRKVAQKCYLPAARMFAELVTQYPAFKITLSMSGTFLEQAEIYDPEVIKTLRELYEAGEKGRQVEFLQETYYHSLVGLFGDPARKEFREQVSLHRRKMVELFGIRPTAFRNTELMYNNDIANVVADMGFEAMLCEQREDMFTSSHGETIPPNAVFRVKGRGTRARQMIVLARNRGLSDDLVVRFPRARLTPTQCASFLARIEGQAVLLGYDYEHIGEHIREDKGIFDFWRQLPQALPQYDQIDVVGNLYGATATNRDTGGYRDKIQTLNLKAWGAVMDHGNGVLFKNYDSGALWWGLSKALEYHRYFRATPAQWETQRRRIMTEARQNGSLDSMVAGYVTAYEQLIGGKHLA